MIMNTSTVNTKIHNEQNLAQNIDLACAQACSAIAPAWPLDQAIAVNPHWKRIALPLRSVAARMGVLAGIHVLPKRELLYDFFEKGHINQAHIQQAIILLSDAKASGMTYDQWLVEIRKPENLPHLPLLIDLLDNDSQAQTRLSWRQAITHQVSQTCAAYFDSYQADWKAVHISGLYDFWREMIQHDHGIGVLMGIPDLGKRLSNLPATREAAEYWVIERLGLPESILADYLEAVLLTVNGWASWCAYLAWQAELKGQKDHHIRELLAIRLAWGIIVLEGRNHEATQQTLIKIRSAWKQADKVFEQAQAELIVNEIGQLALDLSYQTKFVQQLTKTPETTSKYDVEAQAVFCIDVRSEPLRRALEAVYPAVQTFGFAGFFGLAIAYTPLATSIKRPQLPGLLAPTLEANDGVLLSKQNDETQKNILQLAATARKKYLHDCSLWQSTSRWPGTTFSFVEAAGITYLGKLARCLLPSKNVRPRDDLYALPKRYRAILQPRLVNLSIETKLELASRVLHAMGLEKQIAPLVVLVAHGSQSANNAHAASLDCGACCGQTGEVNARALAQLLNEKAVRAALNQKNIIVPEDTFFVAALHNTSTDEIEVFDLDALPGKTRARWKKMAAAFELAAQQLRKERAPKLGLNPSRADNNLLTQLKKRANDAAQTRPEWGLAGNAAFIIAPRERTRGIDFAGRSFLHDYDYQQDADGSVLELLMTAPMIVTHWINWQYHASSCDPIRLGSGNKVLHNVVGGHIGVFEGNGGDLRIGLSQQSLHDGKKWMHTPLRLTVVIDAPTDKIVALIHKHPVIKQLVDHGWLHLWSFAGNKLQSYAQGQWLEIPTTQA